MVESAASLYLEFRRGEFDMTGLRGDWGREGSRFKRHVDYGVQGRDIISRVPSVCAYQTSALGAPSGYSSHFHNPLLIMSPPRDH